MNPEASRKDAILDPYIIEEIKRREEEKRRRDEENRRQRIEIPVYPPENDRKDRKEDGEDSDRGVTIIDYSVKQ